LSDLSCLTEEDARSGIDKVKKASAKISEIRSNIGAEQNALEHNYRINQNTSENTQTAESSIRDTDMASEMVKFARENILARVGESMLAQANQSKQGVMALLT
jgi:flagellin